MTDDRPRPKYGEYAPLPPAQPTPPPPAAPAPSLPTMGEARPRWDLAITSGLLLFAAFDVVLRIGQFLDLAGTLGQVFEMQGIGQFTQVALADRVGPWIVASWVVIFIATLALSIRALQRGRRAFWIPLVGGAAAWIVAGIGMTIVLLQDPAFVEYYQRFPG